MSFGSWDISFCRGLAEQEENGVKVTVECPVKQSCHRFWTEEHTREALKTGDRYHSFIVPGPADITETGCGYFWRKS